MYLSTLSNFQIRSSLTPSREELVESDYDINLTAFID